ncbi:uncharacterized protein [Palaemon carinicauda]|uniref:uncharacterized protein n=1 Tax=Palaemon carinicauda TaxID=392227 RepID=UPI0035B676F3
MVDSIPPTPYQCLRGHGGIPNPKTTGSSQEPTYQIGSRQRSHGPLHKQRGFQVKSYQPCDVSNIFHGSIEPVASVSSPSSGSTKCSGGLTFEDDSAGVGVVTGPEIIQMDPVSGPGSPDRPVCNRVQPQTRVLRSPQPGPSGLRHRRNVFGLEHLGENLFIPTNKSVDESVRQTQNFQGPGCSSSPQLAQKQLVSPAGGTGSPPSTDTQSNTNTSSTNSQCVSFLKNSECPNFMDFMKFAAQRGADIDPQNTLFLESDKRESTLRQYDSAIKKLAKFLRDSKVEMMTMNLTVTFFRILFESGLAASTITTIKSALKKIFHIGFNIDLTDSYFSSIPRACARLKPSTRSSSVSWFLNDVLKLASDTLNESCNYIPLLRKTLFLMSLASGARISELSALTRDPGHIEFLSSGEVLLSPDKRFLAKNEDPQNRWSPWKIVPLPQDPSLCPVNTLKAYLNGTSIKSSGPLFIRENGGTITLKGIRQQILYFIKQANPESFPHVHDIQAVATSINYFHHMNFDELTKYTGWKSPKVFKRHYLKPLEALKFATVAAGNVVLPESNDS